MCGRLDIKTDPAKLAKMFDAYIQESAHDWQPHFNVCPGTPVPIILHGDDSLILRTARWGFEGFKPGVRDIINAKAENVDGRMWGAMLAGKTAKSGRGFVPLGEKDGYYEWPGDAKNKIPTHLRPAHDRPWAMPLLWQERRIKDDWGIRFATITTEPSETTAPYHHRSTAIIDDMAVLAKWMNPQTEIDELLSCLAPYGGAIEAYAVTKDLSTRLAA
jgi:putative SOS response-associated peptidase YedK